MVVSGTMEEVSLRGYSDLTFLTRAYLRLSAVA